MSEEIGNKIQAYLEGNMAPDQREAFEQQMLQDPELSKEVSDLKQLDEGLQALGVEAFQKEVQGWDKLHQPKTSFAWRPLAVAAAVLILLVPAVYLFINPSNSSQDLFYAYYQPYEELVLTRGADDSLAAPGVHFLTQGQEAYNRQAYQAAADNLNEYLQLNPGDNRVALYLAIAQLELDLPAEAEKNFTRAQQDQSFRQQAQWYQALSYLKFDQTEKATVLLSEIAEENSHYRNEMATQLLQELAP